MKKGIFHLVLVLAMASWLTACGGGSGGDSSSSSSSSSGSSSTGDEEFSGQSLEGGNVSEVSFTNNSATLTITPSSNSAEYILSLYHYSETGSTGAYSLSTSATNSNLTLAIDELTEDESVTEDFHQSLREMEASLSGEPVHRNNNMMLAQSAPSIGSTRSFKVLNNFSNSSSYATVTAELVYATDNFLFYIDQRNTDSLSESNIETLAEEFDDLIDKEREIFGTESDVDGDGRFNVLLTQEVNELGQSQGGFITGFFYAVDLFSSDTYSQSNETEIFYGAIPDPTGEHGVAVSESFAVSNIIKSVLPHEYQHMINFNQHYFENNGAAESSFLNEGLSHLAEDLYSLNSEDYMTATGIENPSRVSGYLASIDDICFTCGSSLYQRGGSYLFIRYLYEQAEKGNLSGASSGKEFVQNLLNTDNTGVENIVAAATGQEYTGESFASLLGQYSLAVFLSNTGLSDDDRLEFDGIDLRDSQDDNRGTVLQGPITNDPSSFPFTNTGAGTSASFIQLDSNDIEENNGTFSIEMPEDGHVGGYLIQTGL